MVTTLERPETITKPQAGGGVGHGHCDGCPRCQDAKAGYCPYGHREFAGRHPVCKVCGHCVLRGKHEDDASDLDDYAGHMGQAPPGPSRN